MLVMGILQKSGIINLPYIHFMPYNFSELQASSNNFMRNSKRTEDRTLFM